MALGGPARRPVVDVNTRRMLSKRSPYDADDDDADAVSGGSEHVGGAMGGAMGGAGGAGSDGDGNRGASNGSDDDCAEGAESAGGGASTSGNGDRRGRHGDPALSSRLRRDVLCSGHKIVHPPCPSSRIIRVDRGTLRGIVDESTRAVFGAKGVAFEKARRIAAQAIAPCEAVSSRPPFVRAMKSRKRGDNAYDIRFHWRCRYVGCEVSGTIGWLFAADTAGDADATGDVDATGGGGSGPGALDGRGSENDSSTLVDVHVDFDGEMAPCHFVAQEEYGVAKLRGDSRREHVGKASAPFLRRGTPTQRGDVQKSEYKQCTTK